MKTRGLGRYYRAVGIANITEEGFDLAFKGRLYHINRDMFAWFLGASDKQLMDARLLTGGDPDDHGEYSIMWESLDVLLGANDFLPERVQSVYRASSAEREKYYHAYPEKQN